MTSRPLIYEDDEVKSIQFTASTLQSTMRKNAPFELELGYTQTMMGFLLLFPIPRRILIVGLGGGSLSKYCFRYFPDCRITTVEIEKEVIALRDDFEIPSDDDRFDVVHADGAEYMERCQESADVIMVDGYDAYGLPRNLSSKRFYTHCFQSLRDKGVLVVNLLKSESQMQTYLGRLSKVFANKVFTVKTENDDNFISFALKQDKLPKRAELRARASALQDQHEIKFRSIVTRLRANMKSK
ncbi:MAG: hypothetical protein HY200_00245 [Nitrospirae bacterium]|nr:hypothetical protein [Nitrospirota bacterium]MBI3593367.1 hypothetical protein [Nitrospirota bacterium]